MRLQVNSDISNKLAMWLSRDNVVNTFPIRGSGTVECTRRASLGDGEECVDEGKLVVVMCNLINTHTHAHTHTHFTISNPQVGYIQ